MGGDYIGSDLVEISTGYDYVEMVIDIACGKRLEIVRKRKPCFGFIKFIVSEQD